MLFLRISSISNKHSAKYLCRHSYERTSQFFNTNSTSNKFLWTSSGKFKNILIKGDERDSEKHLEDHDEYDIHCSSGVPKKKRIVICGAGLMGSSVAYHLAKLGYGQHTVLLERGSIEHARAGLASGLVGTYKGTSSQVKLAQKSIELLEDLTNNGFDVGWKKCGSLSLARCNDRMTQFRRMKSQSIVFNIKCEVLSPEECLKICPIIDISDIKGGLYMPNDGIADPDKLRRTLITEAVKKGLTLVENCAIDGTEEQGLKVKGVRTSKGYIECVYFVNCSGFWARNVGQLSEPYVKVPLHPVEHYYLHTKPIEDVDLSNIPYVKDQDGNIYFREYGNGRIMFGGFEKHAKPAYEDGYLPEQMEKRKLPPDFDHFHVLLEQALHRVPLLQNSILDKVINYPEAFSPDCKWILGESPEIAHYLVAAGMKTVGISAAGGVGHAISDIITQGYSSVDLHELEVSRFLGLHNNRKFLRDRVKEVPGIHYSIRYPFAEFQTGRKLRMSPIFPVLKEAGAVFGQVMGYERPNYFDKNLEYEEDGTVKFRISETKTFGKPKWFDLVEQEYLACREKMGLCDYSSFTKIDLWSKGRDVVDALQYLCSNDVDVEIGSIIHTGMQNTHGGYENDCSLARLSENHYMMIAPTIQQTRCKSWIQRHLGNFQVNISDITSYYTAICIMGPFSRLLLSELTDTDLSPKNFPFFTYKELDVGLANGIRAFNLTHTGELGYVLYIPNEFALHVYSRLWETGKKYEMEHCGYYAMRALRLEKFYAYWGQDLDTFTTPLECGRTWRVKFNKNFIGRDALLKQKEEGVKRMYVQLLLNDHDPEIDFWSCGGEPIYRDGVFSGQTTTTGYGFTLKKQVCLGFVQNFNEEMDLEPVTNEFVLNGDYEVEIAGIRYPAKVNLHSPNLPTKYPDIEREAYKATTYVQQDK